jgi:UDP-N-acetylglucosamine diphosphorylase / glucose-1-phosphate thymidylyltransferase / UDP-N-acetylgalactosamine diphosphorylase / glucosamine-1-phosphate N-acetyltransferase / galactosamine-1-phosphate N-acetyltransferase
MNTVFLQENKEEENLYPFSLTRSIADTRIGIFTIREKWERILEFQVMLDEKGKKNLDKGHLFFAANHIPTIHWKKIVPDIQKGMDIDSIPDKKLLNYPWEIFEFNDWAIRQDFEWIKKYRTPVPATSSNHMIHSENIFIEPGAKMEHCILNAENGPIYIGQNALVMEGSMLRGPVAICENAVVKMGTVIYGATTIGPSCTVGGEIKNSVIFGYSNKAHHGYLGDSVIGEWCNLGAGTSNSNMKNSAGPVRVWNEPRQEYYDAGIKCGLFMGDYSRCAINTAFNTGTVVGVCANIFNTGELTAKHISNFSWGSNARYEFEKAIKEIRVWMKMKNKELTDEQAKVLKHIFDHL